MRKKKAAPKRGTYGKKAGFRRVYKKRGADDRNYENPLYVRWRNRVRERDNKTCQWPGCGKRGSLQVHHILKWSEHPLLRYEVSNGICLCSKCHKKIWKKENEFAAFFMSILSMKLAERLKKT
jgi:5-methylcytosine-specific restriction endonuclease McrA